MLLYNHILHLGNYYYTHKDKKDPAYYCYNKAIQEGWEYMDNKIDKEITEYNKANKDDSKEVLSNTKYELGTRITEGILLDTRSYGGLQLKQSLRDKDNQFQPSPPPQPQPQQPAAATTTDIILNNGLIDNFLGTL